MSGLALVILNSFFYLLLFWVAKRKGIKILMLIGGIWYFSSLVGILYFLNPFINLSNNVTFFPFLYLFICLIIGILPFFSFNEIKVSKSKILCHGDIFLFLVLVLVLSSFLPFIESIIRIATKGVDNLGSIYEEERISEGFNPRGYFSTISYFLYSINEYFKFISIPLLYLYLSFGMGKKFIILGLIFAVFNPVLNQLANGQRFYIVTVVYSLLFNYFLFEKFLSITLKKMLLRYSFIFGIGLATIFIAISVSRFGAGSRYDYEGFGTVYQFIRYIGEPFTNFNSEVFHVSNFLGGQNSFKGFYSYFLNKEMSIESQNLATGIKTHFFHTYVGNFYMDFGPILTVVIFSLFSVTFLYLAKKRKGKVKVGTLILFNLYVNVFLFGTTYFVYQNGFIHMIWSIIVALFINLITLNTNILRSKI